jgi:hypothetical protein
MIKKMCEKHETLPLFGMENERKTQLSGPFSGEKGMTKVWFLFTKNEHPKTLQFCSLLRSIKAGFCKDFGWISAMQYSLFCKTFCCKEI